MINLPAAFTPITEKTFTAVVSDNRGKHLHTFALVKDRKYKRDYIVIDLNFGSAQYYFSTLDDGEYNGLCLDGGTNLSIDGEELKNVLDFFRPFEEEKKEA